jgi:hypothetical protein
MLMRYIPRITGCGKLFSHKKTQKAQQKEFRVQPLACSLGLHPSKLKLEL